VTIAVKLLVSVRDASEAADALAGGADWIDLKEPRRGPLGAVDPAEARAVVDLVGQRAPVSAAAGELVDLGGDCQASLQGLLAIAGISHVKLGLSRCGGIDWRPRWAAARDEIAAADKQLVAVIYADAAAAQSPPAEQILDEAIASECSWALWDTFDKSGASIDQRLGIAALSQQLGRARTAGLRTVVAGRVDESCVGRLPLELIDMVAVRGAVCLRSRETAVCAQRTRSLRAILSRHTDCRAVLPR
jgi:uncharacterized protein (UPF0264 family)